MPFYIASMAQKGNLGSEPSHPTFYSFARTKSAVSLFFELFDDGNLVARVTGLVFYFLFLYLGAGLHPGNLYN